MEKNAKSNSILSNYLWSRKIYDQMGGKKYHLISITWILLSIVAPFLSMAFPAFTVNRLQSGGKVIWILITILIFVIGIKVIGTLQAVFDNEQKMCMFLARFDTAGLYEKHMLGIDYEKFESSEGQKKSEAARKAVLFGNDMGIEAFMLQFPIMVMNLIGLFIYSVIVVQIHWGIFAYMLITSFIVAMINWKVKAYDDKYQEDFIRHLGHKMGVRKDILNASNGKDVRIYQCGKWLISKLEDIVFLITKYWNGKYRIIQMENSCSKIFGVIRDGVVYYLLILQISRNQLTVDKLLLYIGVIAGYSIWVKGFLESIQMMFLNTASITDLREFLNFGDIIKEDKEKSTVCYPGRAHELKLVNVGYTYKGSDMPSISKVNLTIHPGEKLALVGMNGAGKSTLIKIICGLYHPTEGEVYLDGQNIETIARDQYFREFSVVFQDVFAFACSVADNISCTKTEETDLRLAIECLEKAGLYPKIQHLEKGIQSSVTKNLDEEGIELSGGEMQKLMLARALYKKTSMLVLDEPTAALDPIAESRMYETYASFATNKTSIFISHRLSSTKFCDRICYMEKGEIKEIGSHEELLLKDGGYAHMFRIQAQYYQDNVQKSENAVEGVELSYE